MGCLQDAHSKYKDRDNLKLEVQKKISDNVSLREKNTPGKKKGSFCNQKAVIMKISWRVYNLKSLFTWWKTLKMHKDNRTTKETNSNYSQIFKQSFLNREKVHRKSGKCKRQATLLITLTLTIIEHCTRNSTIHIISNSLLHREFYRIHTHKNFWKFVWQSWYKIDILK